MNKKLFKNLVKSIKGMISIRKEENNSSKKYVYGGIIIKEGKVKKGGVNHFPTMPPPTRPPKEQGDSVLYKELINDMKRIYSTGMLPDGDYVNMPTKIWVEDWMEKFKNGGIRREIIPRTIWGKNNESADKN